MTGGRHDKRRLGLIYIPFPSLPFPSLLGNEYFRYDELPANLERLRAHRDCLAPIITHRYPVSEIQAAFETFLGGETEKVIIEQ